MSLPSNVADPVRPLIHVDELGTLPLSAVMSAKAPAAMYFVISVLPISITSGVLPPASVASNFCRCVFHSWYWTSTFTSGCCFANAAFAWSTEDCQPDCASTCSQTVMLLAVVFFVAPIVPAAIAAAPTAARQRATLMRLFIRKPPVSGGPVGRSAPEAPQVGWYHVPLSGSSHRPIESV